MAHVIWEDKMHPPPNPQLAEAKQAHSSDEVSIQTHCMAKLKHVTAAAQLDEITDASTFCRASKLHKGIMRKTRDAWIPSCGPPSLNSTCLRLPVKQICHMVECYTPSNKICRKCKLCALRRYFKVQPAPQIISVR